MSVGGDHAQKPKFRDFSEKKSAYGISLGQFLASLISFYFEILCQLACGEKITKLASKSSVKLGEKSTSNF